MISRILTKKLQTTSKSILLLGPRQVGKSTLINDLTPDLKINLANEKTFINHSRDPGLIEREVQAHLSRKNKKIAVFLDEVQRLPTILNTVQSLIDDNKSHLRFFITGSSARKLKRGQANLLPGRILMERMFPLNFWELNSANRFELDRCLSVGSLPEIYLEKNGEQILDSYTDIYLREEIQAEALTKDIGAYARFLDLAAELSGHYLNYAKISSDSEINKETIRRYFSILEETLLIHRIASFTDIKNKRHVRQKDKFVFFDLGVRNSLLKRVRTTFTSTEKGALFEQWLLLQILSYASYMAKDWRISTFRDEYDNEVDIIIESKNKLYLIETKYSDKFRPEFEAKLLKIENIIGRKTEKFVVCRVPHRQLTKSKIEILPVQEFLLTILPGI